MESKRRKKKEGKERNEKRRNKEEKKEKEKNGKESKDRTKGKNGKKEKKRENETTETGREKKGEKGGTSMIEEEVGVRERGFVLLGGVVLPRELERYAYLCCCVGSAVSVFSLDPHVLYQCRSLNYSVRCLKSVGRRILFIYLFIPFYSNRVAPSVIKVLCSRRPCKQIQHNIMKIQTT